MVLVVAAALLLLQAGDAAAYTDDGWSYEPLAASSVTPTTVSDNKRVVYYRTDNAVDSDWILLSPGVLFRISLDPDIDDTSAGSTVQIRYSISCVGPAACAADSNAGSEVLGGITLTGTAPFDAIEDVPGNMWIMVDVTTTDNMVLRIVAQ